MAKFLVKINPAHVPHFIPGVFQEEDIIEVVADDFKFGNKEKLGDFLIFIIPNLPLEKALKYVEPLINVTKYDIDGDPEEWDEISIRRYKIPFNVDTIKTAYNQNKVIPLIIKESDIIDKSK